MKEAVCVTVLMASVGLTVKVSSVNGHRNNAYNSMPGICIVHTYAIGTIYCIFNIQNQDFRKKFSVLPYC